MTSQPSLEARPDEFPYEQLLAYYRGRVRNREQADVMERLTSEDARWKAHWQSVQNLDLKREAFRRDGELLSLPAFLEGLIPELCEIIAETDGEVLHPLFSDEPPQFLGPNVVIALRDLLLNDGCTGVAVLNPRVPMEVQFDEHKLLIMYGHDLEPFKEVLREHRLHHSETLRFITEAEHIHSSTDEFHDQFGELRYRLGVDCD